MDEFIASTLTKLPISNIDKDKLKSTRNGAMKNSVELNDGFREAVKTKFLFHFIQKGEIEDDI